jgi:hypothetical protein
MLAMNVGNIHSASLETHDVVSLLWLYTYSSVACMCYGMCGMCLYVVRATCNIPGMMNARGTWKMRDCVICQVTNMVCMHEGWCYVCGGVQYVQCGMYLVVWAVAFLCLCLICWSNEQGLTMHACTYTSHWSQTPVVIAS